MFSNLSTKERASCELYYKLWREGQGAAQIRAALGVPSASEASCAYGITGTLLSAAPTPEISGQ